MLSSVDLPEPDSPTIATHSPAATSRSTLASSGVPAKDFATPRTSSKLQPGDDAEDRSGEGAHARAVEQPAPLREDGDRRERDRDLQQRHRDREEVVRMVGVVALVVPRLVGGVVLLRVLLD